MVRQGRIAALLRTGKHQTAPQLAEKFEVSVRTIYRDLDFMRDQMRVPLEFDQAEQTWRLTDDTFQWPLVTLSRGELIAIYFAEKVLAQYRGTPYEKDLESTFSKLQDLFPEDVTVDPGHLESYLSLDLGAITEPDPEIFTVVIDGLTRRHRLRIRYSSMSSGRTANRVVDPYHIYNLRGSWYLAAHDQLRDEVRDFALQRIESVKILQERYEIRDDWSFDAYMADSLGIEKGGQPVTVKIRFSARQARRVREKDWHQTMEIRDRRDGGCVLTMSIAGLDEVKRWVMRFGAEAKVLQPKSLRDSIVAELKAMRRMYA